MSIQNYLNQIKTAVFGKDVRQSIHDAIKQCYDDASVDHDNANMEVKLARGTHETLNDRITENEKNQENLSSQLEHNVQQINNKVDKVTGKSLSTNDYNNAEKAEVEKVKSKADISYVNTKVASISSGTPLFASSVAEMTDTTKNYCNLSDGYIYTYDGSSFIKSTLKYQESGISDNQITPIKTSFLELDRNKNEFDGNTFLEGFKLTGDNTTANIEADVNSVIAIIKIEPNTIYTIMVNENELELEYEGRKYFKYMTSSTLYTNAQTNIEHTLNGAKYGTSFTFTSSDTDKYLYVYLSNSSNVKSPIQVLKGVHSNININTYEECYFQKFNVKNDFLEVHNLFDGQYLKNIAISGSNINDITLKSSTNCITAIIPIEGSKDYSAILSETPLFYEQNNFFKWVTSDTLYTGAVYQGSMRIGKFGTVLNKKYLNFTSAATDKYLYIYTNDTNRTDILIEVVEGTQTEMTITSNEQVYKPSKKLSVYSKTEINELLKNIDRQDTSKEEIAWFGDSISKLKLLPHRVAKLINANVYDCSVAGSVMVKQVASNINYELLGFLEISKSIKSGDFTTQTNAANELDNKDSGDRHLNISTLKSIDFTKIKKLVALYGTNDFYHQVVTLEEYKQGMRDAITNILSTYPHIQMYFISPTWRGDTTPNPKGYKLIDYVNAEEEVCNEFNIPFFNLYKNCGINALNMGLFLISDKLHQTEKGDELLSEKCARFLLSN